MAIVIKDVTKQVNLGDVDGEWCPITKCMCGKTFDYGTELLNVDADDKLTWKCPHCGIRLYFTNIIKVTSVEVY